eukprot:345097_1
MSVHPTQKDKADPDEYEKYASCDIFTKSTKIPNVDNTECTTAARQKTLLTQILYQTPTHQTAHKRITPFSDISSVKATDSKKQIDWYNNQRLSATNQKLHRDKPWTNTLSIHKNKYKSKVQCTTPLLSGVIEDNADNISVAPSNISNLFDDEAKSPDTPAKSQNTKYSASKPQFAEPKLDYVKYS